jgi:YggT family protein
MQYALQFADLLLTVLWVAVLIRVLLSWFPIDPSNPLIRVLFEVTEPVLAPFRRVIPRIGMFDLSPLAALLVLQLLRDGLPRLASGF